MALDINFIRSLITATLMFSFIGMVFWAYSSKRKQDFSEAATLPLEDEQPAAGSKP